MANVKTTTFDSRSATPWVGRETRAFWIAVAYSSGR
jgi:hypothetical protein